MDLVTTSDTVEGATNVLCISRMNIINSAVEELNEALQDTNTPFDTRLPLDVNFHMEGMCLRIILLFCDKVLSIHLFS